MLIFINNRLQRQLCQDINISNNLLNKEDLFDKPEWQQGIYSQENKNKNEIERYFKEGLKDAKVSKITLIKAYITNFILDKSFKFLENKSK